jgi:hypothetical protein
MQFTVDDDLAIQIEQLAKRKPFENLNFNEALRRIVDEVWAIRQDGKYDKIDTSVFTSISSAGKKAASPDPSSWVVKVPELKLREDLRSWKAVCDSLKINTAGDSARRKLKKWVEINRPNWPEVPDI